jgi:hypothetical protein
MSETGHAEIGDPMSSDPYIDLDKRRGRARAASLRARRSLHGVGTSSSGSAAQQRRPHDRPSAAQLRVKNTGRGRITSSYCEPTAR